jgi:hypothetical protein
MLHSVDRKLATDVSGQPIGPIFKGQAAWLLKMGPIGCPETSINTNLRCVTSQKGGDLNYTTADFPEKN